MRKVILEGDGRTVERIIKENRVRVGRGLVKFSPAEDAAIVEDTKDIPVEDKKELSAEDTKDIPSEDTKEVAVEDKKKTPKNKK